MRRFLSYLTNLLVLAGFGWLFSPEMGPYNLSLITGAIVVAGAAAAAYGTYASGAAASGLGRDQQAAGFLASQELQELSDSIGLSPEDILLIALNPTAGNPALSASVFSSANLLGAPSQGTLGQGNPSALVIELAQQHRPEGVTRDEIVKGVSTVLARRRASLENGETLDALLARDKTFARAVRITRGARNAAGFPTVDDLVTAAIDFRESAAQSEAAAAAVQPDVLKGQLGALTSISEIQQDFPVASQEGIFALEDRVKEARASDFEDARQDTLARANTFGLNPGAALGKLEDTRQDFLNVGALERALTLLQGQTNISGAGLSHLQQSLIAPTQTAGTIGGNVGQLRNNAGGIFAQQAMALNDLRAGEQALSANLSRDAILARLGGNVARAEGDFAKDSANANLPNSAFQGGLSAYALSQGLPDFGGFGGGGTIAGGSDTQLPSEGLGGFIGGAPAAPIRGGAF